MKVKDKTIHITTIGCGDAFSDGGRLQTCFHVQALGGTFLIDCGATSVAALKRHRFDLNKIDTILISHFHGDHYGGLPYFLLEAAVFGRKEKLTIVSPPGGREKLAALLDLLYPESTVLEKLDLRFMEFSQEENALAGKDGPGYLRISAFPVTHVPASAPHGVRITTAGKVISYSGDTRWDDNLIPIANNADFFICECNFFNTRSQAHLDYKTLTENLSRLRFKQILLTHFGEEMLANLDKVKLPCAEDGMKIII